MLNISHIRENSFVDGPGQRVVLFVQGCSIGCPGCQNRHLWPAAGGALVDEEALAGELVRLAEAAGHKNITISGGEPFEQPEGMAKLTRLLKKAGAHIIIYSGYTFEDLVSGVNRNWIWNNAILSYCNVLVDGPFKAGMDDNRVTWRGSRNQTVIDLAAYYSTRQIKTIDWDETLQITPAGQVVLPVGMTAEFAEIGTVQASRRCGETTRNNRKETR